MNNLQVDLRIVKLVGTLPSGTLTLYPSPGADDPRMDSLIDTNQLADIFGSSPHHLRNIARDVLPFYKIGGNTRFKLTDVLRYIESCRRDERIPRQAKATEASARKRKYKQARRAAQNDAATA